MDFTRMNVPLPEGLIPELTAFWEEIFETAYEDFKPIFAGDETEDNKDILYLMRQGEDLAGTSQSHRWQSRTAVGWTRRGCNTVRVSASGDRCPAL